MSDLRALLEIATDRIEPPGLAATARAEAHRRRRRHRSVLAVAATAASVALVVGLTQLGPGSPRTEPPVDTPTSGIPTPTPSDGSPATQPRWDPFDLVDAPTRGSRLPRELAPPTSPPPLDTAPGVVAAWTEEGADVRVLDSEGGWWTLPGTGQSVTGTLRDVVQPVISSDGTRLAMSTSAGIRVVDVTTGDDRTISWPAPLAPPWDTAPDLRWEPDDGGFVVLDWRGAWLVGLDGSTTPAPYRGRFVSLAADPDGAVYQNDYDRRRLITWEGAEPVHDAPFVQCERLTAGHGLVACTTGSLEPYRSGPVVVDPATGDVVAYAPIADRNAVYSDNGHLTTLGFLDADTLLLLVGPADFRTDEPDVERWHLVDWDFRAGTFEVLSTGGAGMRDIAVAPGVVG